MSKKKLLESVTLSDGRVVTKRNPTVRDMANVGTYAGKDSSLLSYLLFSIKILVDGQPIGYEAFLDTMHETDLEEIGKLFVSEEDLKNL